MSEVLAGANVGLLEIGEAVWSIYFGPVLIGYLDGLTNRAVNRMPTRLDPTPGSSTDPNGTSNADQQ